MDLRVTHLQHHSIIPVQPVNYENLPGLFLLFYPTQQSHLPLKSQYSEEADQVVLLVSLYLFSLKALPEINDNAPNSGDFSLR